MVLYTPAQSQQLTDLVNRLTPLPAAPRAPPTVPSGTVALFADPNWSSRRLDVNTYDYLANRRHRVPSSMLDQATWVAWNLPLGTVMTMTDWPQNSTGLTNASLDSAAGAVDFVGTGVTQSCELYNTRLNDGFAGFFWREVDLWQGAIELFSDPNFTGNFSTVFLSDWPRDTPTNITGWWLNDRVSSFRWKTLSDRQTATLYADPNGTGNRYDNIKGWGSFKEIAVNPKKEVVDPIIIPASHASDPTQLSTYAFGDNDSTEVQTTTISVGKQEGQSLTVETSDSHHVGMSVKVTQTSKAGVEGVASCETSVEVGFNYDFTTTRTVTRTISKTVDVKVDHEINQPPMKHWVAYLTVNIGSMPATDYQTKVTRWYDYPVANGVQDSANNNWYKREEMVTFRIVGSLVATTRFDFHTSDLPPGTTPRTTTTT